MPTVLLTEVTIRNLKPTPGKRVTYLDKNGPKGFGIRVTENGAMSYCLTYGEDRKRVKLGDVGIVTLKAAREQAKTILANAQLGREDASPAITVGAALDIFFEKHCDANNRAKTAYETKRLLNRHIRPKFGKERLSEVSTDQIAGHLDGMLKTPYEANALYTALKTFYRWAVGRRHLAASPVEPLKKPARTTSRARVLSDPEIRAIWLLAGNRGQYGAILRLCILTLQRVGQITNLRREWIGENAITWPASQMKSNREHAVPIGPMSEAILDTLPKKGLLFPNSVGKPFNTFSDAKEEFDRNCRIDGKALDPWRTHDLRRTGASRWQKMGVRLEVTERQLGHTSGPTTGGILGVYQLHEFMEERREATLQWEKYLADLIAEA